MKPLEIASGAAQDLKLLGVAWNEETGVYSAEVRDVEHGILCVGSVAKGARCAVDTK